MHSDVNWSSTPSTPTDHRVPHLHLASTHNPAKSLHKLCPFIYSKPSAFQLTTAPGLITSSFGWALPFPCLLHCPVSLPAPAWELFPVENQRDNTRSLKSLSFFGMWRNSINQLGNNESDVNLNICNLDRVLSHWFPTRKGSHAGAGRKTRQRRRHGRGGA